ncbi:MAG: hypothetical protein ACLT8E_04495 [Akkermansia sp.]
MGGFKEHDRYWNCDAYPWKRRTAPFEESCMRQVREMVRTPATTLPSSSGYQQRTVFHPAAPEAGPRAAS